MGPGCPPSEEAFEGREAGLLAPTNPRRAASPALQAVLEQVGMADALLARQGPKGLVLIDGHLRADLDPEAVVPSSSTWADAGREHRVLFCQREAAETAIYMAEAAGRRESPISAPAEGGAADGIPFWVMAGIEIPLLSKDASSCGG